MKIGAATVEIPIVTPSRKRATSRKAIDVATPCSTAKIAKPIAIRTIVTFRPSASAMRFAPAAPTMRPRPVKVVTHSVAFVERPK